MKLVFDFPERFTSVASFSAATANFAWTLNVHSARQPMSLQHVWQCILAQMTNVTLAHRRIRHAAMRWHEGATTAAASQRRHDAGGAAGVPQIVRANLKYPRDAVVRAYRGAQQERDAAAARHCPRFLSGSAENKRDNL